MHFYELVFTFLTLSTGLLGGVNAHVLVDMKETIVLSDHARLGLNFLIFHMQLTKHINMPNVVERAPATFKLGLACVTLAIVDEIVDILTASTIVVGMEAA